MCSAGMLSTTNVIENMWWLIGSAPDCKTCSPGFKSGFSSTCRDMSFLVGEPAGLT